MMNNNHNDACACSQCAPVPTQPLAPPPVCPIVNSCEEYVESDCVISSVNATCTYTYTNPNTGQQVTIGLDIDQGQTTLSNVYQQLTTTACITNANVINGILHIIQNNPDINQYFTQIICEIDCADPCDNVVEVSQAVFSSITPTGFVINFLAQPNYKYEIRINDTSSLPPVYYTWISPNPPNLGANPAAFSINTNLFTKYSGTPPAPSGPPTALNGNSTHEVYITAINPSNVECEAGPWTVITSAGPLCGPACGQVQLTVAVDPAITTHLAFIVTYQTGSTFPVAYRANIYNSAGTNMIPLNTVLTISNTPAVDPITNLYPTTATNYDYPAIVAPDTYTVEITPICSFQPLFCIGTVASGTINLAAAPSCSPPDITNITITSI